MSFANMARKPYKRRLLFKNFSLVPQKLFPRKPWRYFTPFRYFHSSSLVAMSGNVEQERRIDKVELMYIMDL